MAKVCRNGTFQINNNEGGANDFIIWLSKKWDEIMWDYHKGYIYLLFIVTMIFGICTLVYFVKMCRLIYYKGDLPESNQDVKRSNKKKRE